jgi:Big-like domain-containing protein
MAATVPSHGCVRRAPAFLHARVISALACSVLLPLAAACGGGSPTGPSAPPSLVIAVRPSLAPAAGGVEVPVSGAVELAVLDGGTAMAAEWASSDPAVVSVSPSGVLTGLAEGSATVTARTSKGGTSTGVKVKKPGTPPPPPPDTTVSVPVSGPPACSAFPALRRVPVSSAAQFQAAVADARPGDVIELADGTYTGYPNVHASGTAERRIVLCGTGRAVLQTGSQDSGHALWLDGASYWTLSGLVLTNSMGGLQISRGSHNVVQWVEVHNTGQHAIHISQLSSYNVVRNSQIHHTGRRKPEFGEGVYVGSWVDHWCQRTACQPDRSDRNQVLDTRFGPYVTAEHVQVMEGTTGGVVRGNTFDGAGMGAPAAPWADSWVAVMGNEYVVEDNRGARALKNGFEVYVSADGWGRGNVFRRNLADVQADGYGFQVDSRVGGSTAVACDNTVRNAAGFANVACR